MLAPDINKGLRNDFREAMEQVDQDYLDDMLKQQQVQHRWGLENSLCVYGGFTAPSPLCQRWK